MFNFIRNHQMNIMLSLCAICAIMAVMLLLTKFLSKKRKWILTGMEIIATLLLFFDRLAYIYAGNTTSMGYIMVRVANFIVFFMTSAIVLCFNFYLIDLLRNEGKLTDIPKRLVFTGFASSVGMLMAIISAFTGLYYYFDSQNLYHRGRGFLICYIIPVVCPVVQYTVAVKYRKCFSKFIYTALSLYVFFPIAMGIIQIFTYGISIVNMAMVLVSISLYFLNYLDVNNEISKAHNIEIQAYKAEQRRMKNIFSQAAKAFTTVMEEYKHAEKGSAERSAKIAKELAKMAGKDEDECDKIYFAAFICDAGEKALSYIKDYPFLRETTLYIGKPYSDSIPEYARIITVAKDYDRMLNDPSIPNFYLRDYFIREAGNQYDPLYAKFAVRILDKETNLGLFENNLHKLETELICNNYRESISSGVEITQNMVNISFDCVPLSKDENEKIFSIPSIILFDSSDGMVQKTQEEVDSHKYLEYGEIWFDSHIISTGARTMEIRNLQNIEAEDKSDATDSYKISFGRFEDHLILKMQNPHKIFEVIVALPSASRAAYIAITGENICIRNLKIQAANHVVEKNEIPRINEKINYINRIESDVPNIQIEKPLAGFTEPIEVKNSMKLFFHTQSLPDANLVWHCPYIIIYHSDDKKVYGNNYRQYAMIKFDGEDNESTEFSENKIYVKKTESFKNWEEWEAQNKVGYESQIDFSRAGNEITLITQNKGIFIHNTTKILDGTKEIYVALSGDQVALTDIRVR